MVEKFNEIRSLMHAEHLGLKQRKALWAWINSIHTQHPGQYEEVVKPYLMSYPRHFEQCICQLNTFDEYQKFHRIAPFASFMLTCSTHNLSMLNDTHKQCMEHPNLKIALLSNHYDRLCADGTFHQEQCALSQLSTHSQDMPLLADRVYGDATRRHGWTLLFQQPFMASLAKIHVGHDVITSEAMQAFVSSPAMQCIESIYFDASWDESSNALDLLINAEMPRLSSLHIARLHINGEMLLHITRASWFNHLSSLSVLHYSNIDDHTLLAFAELAQRQHKLKRIQLYCNSEVSKKAKQTVRRLLKKRLFLIS